MSNHGNPSYTCIYRVQVHGVPEGVEKREEQGEVGEEEEGVMGTEEMVGYGADGLVSH